ncbi:response regulator [Desulfovibrio sp. OttesenSCG-928-O18]|nr:response regulator [Desulfovibrio sp. OttesenSCG-928-O18]
MPDDTAGDHDIRPHAASRNTSSRDPARWFFDGQPHVRGHVTWEWDIPANIVLYSREWRHIMMRPDDDTVENTLSSWWPHVHDDDVKPFLEAARDIVEGVTEHYQTLFRVQREDGSWVWLLSRGRVTEKTNGKACRVSGALMDITCLRSDVKFQHGSTGAGISRYRAMLENSPDLIARMDRESIPMYVNPNISRYLACGPQGLPDADSLASLGMEPGQRAFMQRCVERVFAEGVALRELVTLGTGYGHNVIGEYSFWPEFDEEGKVVAAMTQFRDLTDQVLAERRARLNEMRLTALHRLTQMSNAAEEDVLRFAIDSLVELTESESGFLFFPHNYPGRKGRMVWSRSLHALLDADDLPDDTLPEDFLEVTTADDGTNPCRTIRNGNNLQPVHLSHGGKVKVLRYIAAPVFDENRVVCIAGVCNKKDIEYREDDLQQLEAFVSGAWLILRRHDFVRKLQRAKEAAEHASKVKDAFLANVSHELRTPLNGMLGMLQLLDLLNLSDEQREYVQTASVSGRALLRIISDILDFSRMESGKMRLQIEPFDCRGAIESSLGLFRREAERKGLGFEVNISGDFPQEMLGDGARVQQIIFNIVGNALKFTEQGGIRVDCSLLPHGGAGSAWVYLAVRDTGIGIPLAEQARIFEAFTQIDNSSTRKYAGTGLGLSIVQRLVELMGGGITVESAAGEGTTIHCSLRFALLPATAEPRETLETAHTDSRNVLDILVAEDDEVGRLAMRAFLQRLGHRPVCVENGRMALEALQLHPFHCLFTDIQMPDMDGLEVVRRIRANDLTDIAPSEKTRETLRAAIPGEYSAVLPVPGDIVAVTVSAHTMSGDRERFLKAGMDFYISKPIMMKELAEVLGKVAERMG